MPENPSVTFHVIGYMHFIYEQESPKKAEMPVMVQHLFSQVAMSNIEH